MYIDHSHISSEIRVVPSLVRRYNASCQFYRSFVVNSDPGDSSSLSSIGYFFTRCV